MFLRPAAATIHADTGGPLPGAAMHPAVRRKNPSGKLPKRGLRKAQPGLFA